MLHIFRIENITVVWPTRSEYSKQAFQQVFVDLAGRLEIDQPRDLNVPAIKRNRPNRRKSKGRHSL